MAKKSKSKCNTKDIIKTGKKVAKRSNAKNPIQSGNPTLDKSASRVPHVNTFNKGFNIGKAAFILKELIIKLAKKNYYYIIYKKGDCIMKIFVNQLLILAGIDFAISFIFSFIPIAFLNFTIMILFFVLFVVLCFKKKYLWISKIQDKYKKISFYLSALGFVKIFGLVFITPIAAISGYQYAMAQYNNVEYTNPFGLYITVVNALHIAVLIGALVYATYLAFFKKKKTN